MKLTTRTKNAIKPALAMVIAYGISLGMGWENPYWAGFAVAMISLSTLGQSLNKGVMRILGTLVAGTAALIFIAWFVQDRWWFIGTLSIYLGFCVYMVTGKKHTYFWWCAAFVVLVICAHAAGEASNAFDIAVLRVQQTGMGVLVYTLVSVFLWPSSSRGALDEVTQKLFTTQATIYRTYRDLLSGYGTPEDSRPLRMQEVQLLNQHAQSLSAAETDSYGVWEVRHQWRRFHHQSTALMEALERWRGSFNEIQTLDRSALLPNLEAVCSEIELRFEEIKRMLSGKPPLHTPQAATLEIDTAAAESLSHFQKAALAVHITQFGHLEALSRALFDNVRDIKRDGDGRTSSYSGTQYVPGRRFSIDPDRLQAALRTMAAVWTAFLIWFYVDPPGHSSFVEMAIIFLMASLMIRQNPATVVPLFLIGSVLAGILYVFVMPHLSGYAQLGAMIFGATFAIYYLLWQPHQAAAKLVLMVEFLSTIAVQNQQTYDFAHYANSFFMLAMAGALAIAIWYLPPSLRPEKQFLRLLARFYRQSEFLISRMALDWKQRTDWIEYWKLMFYQNDLLELPQKLRALGGQIDQRLFPSATPEQVQIFVNSLQALALRLKDLAEMRKSPQATLLVQKMLDDVRSWRIAIQEMFQRWSDDPAAEPHGDLQNRLAIKVKEMENRIDRTLSQSEQRELSDADYRNFYQLIGSYRGLSEPIAEHAKLVKGFDWQELEEERF